MRLGISKHLPGQHDQKRHGNRGTGSLALQQRERLYDETDFGDIDEVNAIWDDDSNPVQRLYKVGDIDVMVRSKYGDDGDAELTPEMRSAIESIPPAMWNAARQPKIVIYTDTDEMAYYTAPSGMTYPATAQGLFIYDQPGGDSFAYHPDGAHTLYLSAFENIPDQPIDLQGNLVHELGHSIFMFDNFPNAHPTVKLAMSQALSVWEATDPPLVVRDVYGGWMETTLDPNDPWLYPRQSREMQGTNSAASEYVAEAFMKVATGQDWVIDETYRRLRAKGEEPADIIGYMNGFWKENDIPVVKRFGHRGFTGYCGTSEMVEAQGFVELAKHRPGGQDHDQSNHGRRGGIASLPSTKPARLTSAEIDTAVAAQVAEYERNGNPRVEGGWMADCTRCSGRGYMEEYKGILGGVCFKCAGNKYFFRSDESVRSSVTRELRESNPEYREWKRNQKLTKLEANMNAARDANPDLDFYFDRYEEGDFGGDNWDDFLMSVGGQAKRTGKLSEKQVAVIPAAMKRFDERMATLIERDARIAAIPDYPTGRFTATGTILSTKWQDSQYGATLKMLVELEDGNKAWGTVPVVLQRAAQDLPDYKGLRIKFDADFERSRDDEHFGFYKRPTGVEVVEEIAKHYPGGQDHDQKNHGRRGRIAADLKTSIPNPRLERAVLNEREVLSQALPPLGRVTLPTDFLPGDGELAFGAPYDTSLRIDDLIKTDPIVAVKVLQRHFDGISTKLQAGNYPNLMTGRMRSLPPDITAEMQWIQDSIRRASTAALPDIIARGTIVKGQIEDALANAISPVTDSDMSMLTVLLHDGKAEELAPYRERLVADTPEVAKPFDQLIKARKSWQEKAAANSRVYEARKTIGQRIDQSGPPQFYLVPRTMMDPGSLVSYDERNRKLKGLVAAGATYDPWRTSIVDMPKALSDELGYHHGSASDLPGHLRVRIWTPSQSLRLKSGTTDLASVVSEATPVIIPNGDKALSEFTNIRPPHGMMLVRDYAVLDLLGDQNSAASKSATRISRKSDRLAAEVASTIALSDSSEATIIGVLSEHRSMGGEIDLHNARPTTTTRQLQHAAEAFPSDWIDDANASGPIRVTTRKGARAYYYYEKYGKGPQAEHAMTIGSNGGTDSDLVHELHHHFEHTNVAVRSVERAFYEKRTAGEPLVSLRQVTGNIHYGRNEMTRVDKWANPYMGKQYAPRDFPYVHPGTGRIGSNDVYEMFSTAYPSILGRQGFSLDEEHTAFVLGMLVTI